MTQGAHARGRAASRHAHRRRRRTPTLRRTTAYAALFTAVPVMLGISVGSASVETGTQIVGARIAPSQTPSPEAAPAVEVVPGVILSPRADARRAERTRRAARAQRQVLADLGTIPGRAVTAYRAAARSAPCTIDWTLIAAIGLVETDHGRYGGASLTRAGVATPSIIGPALTGSDGFALIRDTDGGRIDGDRVHDRAVGPMQFIPGTWRWAGADGDSDGRRDPHDIDDAAAATAGYLCRVGDLRDAALRRAAVLTYNQSGAYADAVLSVADAYAGGDFRAVAVVATEPEKERKKARKPRQRGSRADRERREPAPRPTTTSSPRAEPTPTRRPAPRPEPTPRPRPSTTPSPSPSPSPSETSGPSAAATTPTPTG